MREALRRLEGEGLVVISPNRGAIVRPLSPKDVVDLYDLRLALETLALRRAAERHADLRESTRRRHAQARHAIATRSLATLFRLDRDFHADIAAASDNPHLVATLGGHWSQIMRVMHAYFEAGAYPTDTWDDHEAIADAVAHGDGDLAVARLTAHLTDSRDAILAQLRANRRPAVNLARGLPQREAEGRPVRVGLIGAGKFGTMILAQLPDARGAAVRARRPRSGARARRGGERRLGRGRLRPRRRTAANDAARPAASRWSRAASSRPTARSTC